MARGRPPFFLQGHRLKNPGMKLRHKLDTISSRTRVIITGTPIQVVGASDGTGTASQPQRHASRRVFFLV